MIKKCRGCGINLQNIDKTKEGYTPELNNKYCQRCFKITNYNESSLVNLKYTNKDIIKKINEEKSLTLFLSDFLSLNENVINLYQMISNPKILVITKIDLLPKNISKDKVLENIKRIYKIDNVIYFSHKSNSLKEALLKKIAGYSKVILAGVSNVGKSSLLNFLTNAKLTVSNKFNTTLDFLKIKDKDILFLDSPGFVLKTLDNLNYKNIIKEYSYELKEKYFLKIEDIFIGFDKLNNVTFYLPSNLKILRRVKNEDFKTKIKIKENSDVIILNTFFLNVKKECTMEINLLEEDIDVRESIVGL